jgi:hypothetical protein
MGDEPLKISFRHFLEKFPEIEFPVTLGEDTHHIFSSKNDPLPALMIEQFILPIEEEEVDEYTEFVPCFRMPSQKEYEAIVYWRAGLLNYQYILVTFGKDEKMIDKRVIGGSFYDGDTLTQSVATLDADGQIIIASGQDDPYREKLDADKTTAYRLQIGTKGKIVNF